MITTVLLAWFRYLRNFIGLDPKEESEEYMSEHLFYNHLGHACSLEYLIGQKLEMISLTIIYMMKDGHEERAQISGTPIQIELTSDELSARVKTKPIGVLIKDGYDRDSIRVEYHPDEELSLLIIVPITEIEHIDWNE